MATPVSAKSSAVPHLRAFVREVKRPLAAERVAAHGGTGAPREETGAVIA
jgi:hypothetical protein